MPNSDDFFWPSITLIGLSLCLIIKCLFILTGTDLEFIKENIAIIIATFALLGTLSQAWSAKVSNSNSVRPFITTDIDMATPDEITIKISNVGNGPAIIKYFEYSKSGEVLSDIELQYELHEFFEPCIIDKHYRFYKNGALGAGESVTCLSFFPTLNEDVAEKIDEFMDTFSLRIEYESLYGESYLYDTINSHRR